ncbi:MAG: aldehyde dehydrogenase family protein [Candidatus Neomarinimicrobiota bacterium]|nr:aldehyde dehydrogenase family protein [Candidatus Neomarinimicrobiota bacterium]|tara:strand:- start:2218 stop:3654 length:1437 start_codon:yes stop_codon:yes gene_type:complete
MKRVVKNFSSYINGAWVQSEEIHSIYNPANLKEHIQDICLATSSDAKNAVLAARNASEIWSNTETLKRISKLHRIMNDLENQRNEVAEIITLENGKTILEARGEVDAAISEGNYQLEYLKNNLIEFEGSNKLLYRPLGVALLITPWNFPLSTVIRKMIPALACGNTIVLKPSEYSSLTSLFIFEILDNNELPKGSVNLVLGPGNTLSDALINTDEVDIVSFTGSTATGESIQKKISHSNVRYQAEMGGANALVVWDDANIEMAVSATIASGYACAGQWCTGISKLIIHESVYKNCIDILKKSVENIQVGNGLDQKTAMGPLCNKPQLNKMIDFVNRAADQGAEILTGGSQLFDKSKNGYFFQPTLLSNMSLDMEVSSEEIFGPIINVFKTNDINQAIKYANLGKYGLSFSVYTSSESTADRFISNVNASICHVNMPTPYREVSMPFTGWKLSGKGIPESGRFARDAFTKPKVVYRAAN